MENFEYSNEEIQEYAEYIGINLEKDPKEILEIAIQGLQADLPAPWNEFTNENGEIYFCNNKTGQVQWDHPLDDLFRNKVIEFRNKHQQYYKQFDVTDNEILLEYQQQIEQELENFRNEQYQKLNQEKQKISEYYDNQITQLNQNLQGMNEQPNLNQQNNRNDGNYFQQSIILYNKIVQIQANMNQWKKVKKKQMTFATNKNGLIYNKVNKISKY